MLLVIYLFLNSLSFTSLNNGYESIDAAVKCHSASFRNRISKYELQSYPKYVDNSHPL